jgi:predicted nucleotidyltransferase
VFTPEEREEAVDRVVELLREDNRIEGAVLVGSMLGEADRWSDIDLCAVVEREVGAPARDFRQRIYETTPVVHHFETAFGETLVCGYLLDSLLEIDVAFDSVSNFSLWGPGRLLFDRNGRVARAMETPERSEESEPDWAGEAGFAWHDVLHAAAAVYRGKFWQALWYTERVRNRTLKLAQERRGYYADFFDYADDLPEEERTLEPAIARSLEPGELLRALEAATDGLIAELRRGNPALAEKLEKPLLEFVRHGR